MNMVLKVFGIFVLLLIIVGLILPNDVDVRRSVEIQQSKQVIHEYTNNLERWSDWSPWLAADPTIKTTIGEIKSGVGASQSWVGASGSGKLTITESNPENGIVYDMTFDGDPTVYKAGVSYEDQGASIKVTWYMTGKMKPIIIGNYFAQLMDMLVGSSFQQGLELLKQEVEK